jgi:hypothetical protein
MFSSHSKEDLVLSESSLGNTHTSDRFIQLVGIFLCFLKNGYQSLTVTLNQYGNPKVKILSTGQKVENGAGNCYVILVHLGFREF